MWQRWQGFDDSFILGNLQGPHCVLNIFENNSQMRLHPCISIPEFQAKTFSYSHLPMWLWQVAFLSLWWATAEAFWSRTLTRRTSRFQTTTQRFVHQQNAVTTDVSRRAHIPQIRRRVWPKRVRTDLLWAIPLISAGRENKLRFEGHTRPTCSLMLQLNVCFLGIC